MSYPAYFSEEARAVLDRMSAIMNRETVSSLLDLMPQEEHRVRLVEAFGLYGQSTHSEAMASATSTIASCEERIASMTAHGQALQDSLAQCQQANDSLAASNHALQGAIDSLSSAKSKRPHVVKLEVTKYSGNASDKLLHWIHQVTNAAQAQLIDNDELKIAFAMSCLKGRAESWAFSRRVADPDCFESFEDFIHQMKEVFIPPNSDFRYRANFLAAKQGKRTITAFVEELRYLLACINDEESLPEATRVTVFMTGLNDGPARTQLFRTYPKSFDEAVRIALSEKFSVDLAHGKAASDDMDISVINANPLAKPAAYKCYNCNKLGHFSRDCPEPRQQRDTRSDTHQKRDNRKDRYYGRPRVPFSPRPGQAGQSNLGNGLTR